MNEGSNFFTSSPALIIVQSFYRSHPSDCDLISHCVFCISLMANNIESHARKCLLASPIYVVSDEISIQKLHFYLLVIEYDFKVYFT